MLAWITQLFARPNAFLNQISFDIAKPCAETEFDPSVLMNVGNIHYFSQLKLEAALESKSVKRFSNGVIIENSCKGKTGV